MTVSLSLGAVVLVREWLDRFGAGVKRDPIPAAFFRYKITMDSNFTIFVGRVREGLSNYLLFRAEAAPTPSQVEQIKGLSEDQKRELFTKIKLELARLAIGYSGLSFPDARDFHLSKRIPISEALTEHEFISALEDVEAALSATIIVFQSELEKANSQRRATTNG